jgi:ATP-dependent exoDNAse (exonuclease V) alpha subunit
MFCQPANPKGLFDEFWQTWTDDIERKSQRQNISIEENQLKTMLLLDLEVRLNSFEKTLADFGLPQPSADDIANVETITNTDPVVIREERDYNIPELMSSVENIMNDFTKEQSLIFDTVLTAVKQQQSLWLFMDARGGCGKTFLLNAILSAVRSLEQEGCVALAMATTGIASNLLKLGRTFHSRLKAPLTPNKESMLQIRAQSDLAKLVRMARLLLIDESTMLDKFQLEALDRSLRDLMNIPNQPFGGKIIILAGDFRQCLPVVPGASRAGTVSHCINKSNLWPLFKVLQLTENMRVRASGDATLEAFDEWTLSIGNGAPLNGSVLIPDNMIVEIVPNTKTETKNEENSMKKFCQEIFPDLKNNINKPGWLEGRTILAPTNKEVDAINEMVQNWLSETGIKLSSADTVENPEDAFRFNTEYLNTLRPNGFPQHTLNLKEGMPLMILRNINPRQGLCNGTRVIFGKCIDNKLLQCKIVETGRIVLIPRITFIPKLNEYPFEWQRRQFPVRPAFAMTINKSQGQTLKHAGIWLRGQVFTHGQLYVACSRVSSPEHLKFAVTREANSQHFTSVNIVYKEVLLRN